jgi:hypothetical protein
MLLEYLNKIPDKRRGQGKQYQLGYVILFAIFAILAGANGYAGITRFIEEYFYKLDDIFDMGWVRAPHNNTLKGILKSVDTQELEKAFREYTKSLVNSDKSLKSNHFAIDGKTLRKSFDNMKDQKSLHMLSIFAIDSKLIFAHKEVDEKSNEIPAAQKLIGEMGFEGCIFTLDAMHCQKNI